MNLKIQFIVSLLLVFPVFSQAQDFQLLESFSTSDLEEQISAMGIPGGFFVPDNGVDFYSVSYKMLHPNGDSIDVSGAVCIPRNISCALPMATYQHGTVFSPDDVPSQMNGESMLGVLFASKGFIVPMPDYIGLGESSDYLHLYIHAESEAQAGLDLLRSVRDAQTDLDFQWNEELCIFGYSQGGHAAAALQRKIETEFSKEFNVTASVPMSGPYDLSGAQADFVLSGEPYPTPGYLPYLILGYQEVYGNIYSDLEDILLPEYVSLVNEFLDGDITLGQAQSQLPNIPSEMIQPDFLSDLISNPNNPLAIAMADNSLLDWAPVAPTTVVYCTADDQVSFQNSLNALEAWEDNGSTTVSAVNGGPFDHGGCVLPALLTGLNEFTSLTTLPAYADITFSTTPDSEGAGLGEITATLASEGFTLTWPDGSEGNTLSSLTAGVYEVEVTSDSGCTQIFQVEVEGFVGLTEYSSQNLSVYPNPAQEILILEFEQITAGKISLIDLTGKTVKSESFSASKKIEFQLSNLESGLYFIQINDLEPFKVIKE